MKKPVLIGAMGLLMALTSLTFSPEAESAGSSARISSTFGTVQARSRGGWRRAFRSQALYPGMTIRTGSRSRTQIRYNDGSVIRLGSRSVIRVRNSRNVRLLRGKSWIKKRRNNKRIRVRTPIAVASVLGTELFVSHNDKNISHVTTLTGLVEVEKIESKEKTLVKPGMWVEIEPDKTLEEPTKFDWNTLKKKERFLLDPNFIPPDTGEFEEEEDWM